MTNKATCGAFIKEYSVDLHLRNKYSIVFQKRKDNSNEFANQPLVKYKLSLDDSKLIYPTNIIKLSKHLDNLPFGRYN